MNSDNNEGDIKENSSVQNCGMYFDSVKLTTTISEWSSDEEIVKAAKTEMRRKYKNQEL